MNSLFKQLPIVAIKAYNVFVWLTKLCQLPARLHVTTLKYP